MQTFDHQRLLALRREAGYNRERLGVSVGRSLNAVANWECGRSTPSADVVGRLADELGVDVSAFYTDAPERVPA